MSVMEKLSAATQLEVVGGCERVCHDYAYFVDAGRMDEWIELFADDAVMVLFGQTHNGKAAIKAAMAAAGGGGGGGSMHVTSNVRVVPTSETEAEGSAYVVVYVKPAADAKGPLAPVAVGIYRDRFKRTSAGWKFARREFEPFAMAG